jgi:hypothetical protein
MIRQPPQYLRNFSTRIALARTTGIVALVALVLALMVGCRRNGKPRDAPPFTDIDRATYVHSLFDAYQQNEAKADELYKGKKVLLERAASWPLEIKTDKLGKKYIVGLTISDKIKGDREVIRYYLYRPDKPIIEPDDLWDVYGICSGKIDGIIVFRDCYLKGSPRGPTW